MIRRKGWLKGWQRDGKRAAKGRQRDGRWGRGTLLGPGNAFGELSVNCD